MDRDKSGESGAFLFSRRVPDFGDGRRSFPTNENSNLYRRGRRRWISLITNPLYFWAPVSLSYICGQISSFGAFSSSRQIQYRKNLGQTSGDYPIHQQNLGRSAKSKIRDRLGFSRHMKTIGKTITLHVHHAFLYISLPSLRDYDAKMPNFTFCGRTWTQGNHFLLIILNFDSAFRTQLQKKMPRFDELNEIK